MANTLLFHKTPPRAVPVLVTSGAQNGTQTGQFLQPPEGVTLLPAEQVTLLTVELPGMPAAQRRAAVAFAVEDRIAQGLEDVQVVPYAEMSPGRWLVLVVAHSALAEYSAVKSTSRVWPDVLLIPVPAAGWSVWAGGERVLVRLGDGSGFATTQDRVVWFWSFAGSPPVTLYGGALPATIPVLSSAELATRVDPALSRFDLRSGRHVDRAMGTLPKSMRALVAILFVAALGHLSLLAVDVLALNRMADEREAALRLILKAPVDADLETILAQTLAERKPVVQDGLLPLLANTFSSMAAFSGQVSVQALRYTATDHSAVLTLEAPDLATLQSVEEALNGAGLAVTAGATTTDNGAADVQLTVRGSGA